MAKKVQSRVMELRDLADDPDAQCFAAHALLRHKQPRDVITAALTVLAERPYPPARRTLLDMLERYSRNGGTHDPGSYLRRRILDALRPITEPVDIAVLARAVETYEFFAPDFKEDAVLLRASALVALSILDEELARYYAVRLLSDGYANVMSGEPALTAVRVLAVCGEYVALYAYVMQPAETTLPEVVSAALRELGALPTQLIPGVVHQHAESKHSVVLLSLIDMLLGHEAGPQGKAYLFEFLRDPPNMDLYRYIVTALVATVNPSLLDDLIATVRFEQNPKRVEVLVDALEPVAGYGPIAEILPALTARLD